MVLSIKQNRFSSIKEFFANIKKEVVCPLITFILSVYMIYDMLASHDSLKQILFVFVSPLACFSLITMTMLSASEAMNKNNSKNLRLSSFIFSGMNGGVCLMVILLVVDIMCGGKL